MNYICKICGKSFDTKQKLAGHMTSHQTKESYHCTICNKDLFTTKGGFNHHVNNHKKNNIDNIDEYNKPQDNLFCRYCGQQWETLNKLKNHEAWCELNPNHRSKEIFKTDKFISSRSHIAWNKGLTKDTDLRIRKQRETYNKNKELGLHKSSSHPRTETTKETLRQKALSNSYQRVCKKTVEYIKKDNSIVKLDSTYEVRTAQILDMLNIDWIRPDPLTWIDKESKQHHYFPDFYLTDYDLYLDTKNDYCFKVQAEKINYIKQHYDNVVFMEENDINVQFIKLLLNIS